MKKFIKNHPYLFLLAYSALFALVSIVYINLGDVRHDYTFHLGRLAGLVQSFEHGDFLPSLNFAFTKGVGYASPMFYGNWQFYLPALLYLLIRNVAIVYSFYVFLLTSALACSMYYSVLKIGKRRKRAMCAALLSTLVLTWFGYGMTMVATFVPILFYAMYKVLYQDQNNPVLLGVIIGLLIQTHLLSTAVLAFSSLIFVLLNVRRWTMPRIISFVQSALIGLVLASGFLIQYVEQSNSQMFFFHWAARDYPFSYDMLLKTFWLWESIFRSAYIPMLVVLIVLLVVIKRLQPFCQQLVIVCVITFLLQTHLIPGVSLLKQTPVLVLQDLRRISFFVPLLVVMALALSLSLAMNRLVLLVQAVVYGIGCLMVNLPTAANLEQMGIHQEVFDQSRIDPEISSFGASGDEYFTLNINPANVEADDFGTFMALDNVEVTNIQKGYNNLEFDYQVIDESQPASMIVPRIWYKGYQVEYSNGASGSEPALRTSPLTDEQKAQYKKDRMPDVDEEVLYDGKISLDVQGSGHVKLYYQKTGLQIFGFVIETIAWLMTGIYSLWKMLMDRSQKDPALADKMAPIEEKLNEFFSRFKNGHSIQESGSSPD